MNDDELEQVMRAGLERRARRADVDVAVADRARKTAGGRRTRTLAVVGVAAAAVVAVAVTGVVVARDDRSPGAAGNTTVPTDPATTGTTPGGVRTEYWRDTQVDVPADWGWGTTPGVCGSPPVGEPYVGRPLALTDDCGATEPDATPTAPYLWFDAPGVEPGTVDLGDGWARESVEINGSIVSVATDDAGLRRRILDSGTGGEACLSEVPMAGQLGHDRSTDPTAPPAALRVCAYDVADSYLTADLTFAITLDRQAADEYAAAVAAGEQPRDQCPTIDYQLEQAVLIELLDAEGRVLRQDAVNTHISCAGVAVGARDLWELETARLTPAMVRPWAVAGIPFVVTGPPGFGLGTTPG